jgi:hypothetical protein
MRIPGRSRVWGVFAVLVAMMASVLVPAPASADPTIQDVRRFTIVRINCDDEMESFSDELILIVRGEFWGTRNNMDGGDWWDIGRSGAFNDTDSVLVQVWENDGHLIGEHAITAADAFRGLIVIPWSGSAGTGYAYRLTYFVD